MKGKIKPNPSSDGGRGKSTKWAGETGKASGQFWGEGKKKENRKERKSQESNAAKSLAARGEHEKKRCHSPILR